MTRTMRNGTVMQGGLAFSSADFGHLDISNPVMGVVLDVFPADSLSNETAANFHDRRGYCATASVLILNDGTDAPTLLPNVIILPPSGTGHDDFSEELPQPTTGTIDGARFHSGYEEVQPWKLNGSYCIVQFVGGSIAQPIMTHWFPHPGNRKDAITSGLSMDSLHQGRRIAKRFQGTRLVLTSTGTVLLDTSQANHKLQADRASRDEVEKGGDIRVTVKNERELEVNFNKPVFDENEPDFLWERNEIQSQGTREEVATRILADKDFIKLLAGEVAQISAADNVYLGDVGATENFVLGQQLKDLLTTILNALISHIHPTGVGPSGPPLPPSLTNFQEALSKVSAEDILSSWIFGQKEPP